MGSDLRRRESVRPDVQQACDRNRTWGEAQEKILAAEAAAKHEAALAEARRRREEAERLIAGRAAMQGATSKGAPEADVKMESRQGEEV